MIARVWRGTAPAATAAAYEDHLRAATFPALERLAGYEGAYVLRRPVGDDVQFMVVTLWAAEDAIRAFAGDDAEAAVVPPEARALLGDFDERALHYEVSRRP